MSKITLRNIHKSFADAMVLDEVHLNVAQGELVSLLGPSGCGKTTTLKIIAGLLAPDRGAVFIGDELVNQVPVEKRGAVIVFQDFLLFPHMTVAENIGFGLKMAGKSKPDIRKQVSRMLELVQLADLGKRYPSELSGGQKQRVALARALAVEPRVLLLDEPFSNLDSRLKDSVREFTLGIQKTLGITTILVTHEKEEALMYSDRVAIMLGGKIRQYGTPEELYRTPATLEVANFLGDNNLIEGTLVNGGFSSPGFGLTGLKSKSTVEHATALIRPEDLIIDEAGPIEAYVLSRKFAGDRTHYTVRVQGRELRLVSGSGEKTAAGEVIRLTVKTNNVLIYDQGGNQC